MRKSPPPSSPLGHRLAGIISYPLLLWLALESALMRVPGMLPILVLVPLGVLVGAVGPRRLRSYGLALATAAGLAYVTYNPILDWQIGRAHERGVAIAVALETYHAAQGHYPDSLAQLVPAALPVLPVTGLGVFRPYPFQYRPPSPVRPTYSLWFGRGGSSIERFNKLTGQWHFVKNARPGQR